MGDKVDKSGEQGDETVADQRVFVVSEGEPRVEEPSGDCDWDDVQGRVAMHHWPVLALPPDSDQYRGIYWDGQEVCATADLGADRNDALAAFRTELS